MATILFAWELGANYGHIYRLLPLAQELQTRGHRPVFVLRDLARTEPELGSRGFELAQAPVWMPRPVGMPEVVSYPHILMRNGYLDVDGLTGLVRAWKTLFAHFSPDLLVADHSPSALLAGRRQSFPSVLFGNGFCSPPRITPMPSMRWWEKKSNNDLAGHEQKVLEVVNAVLKRLHATPLEMLADLFNVEHDFLSTLPELDHYPSRGQARYYGAPSNTNIGVPPVWPTGSGKKIFAYLQPGYEHFDALLSALSATKHLVLIHAPGLSWQKRKIHESASIAFSDQPVQLAQAFQACDLVICHSGIGVGSAALVPNAMMKFL